MLPVICWLGNYLRFPSGIGNAGGSSVMRVPVRHTCQTYELNFCGLLIKISTKHISTSLCTFADVRRMYLSSQSYSWLLPYLLQVRLSCVYKTVRSCIARYPVRRANHIVSLWQFSYRAPQNILYHGEIFNIFLSATFVE